MKKTTRGRNVQHIPPTPAKTEINRKGHTRIIRRALKGRAISHEPRAVSDKIVAKNYAGFAPARFLNWKDTDAARRRGWDSARS